MLIDKLGEKGAYFDGKPLSSSMLFYINERSFDFRFGHKMKKLELPSRLPFNLIALHFSDGGFAVYKEIEVSEGLEIRYQMMGPSDLNAIPDNLKFPYAYCADIGNDLAIKKIGKSKNGEFVYAKQEEKREMIFAVHFISILDKFLSFLSCKNITYEQEHPPAKLQKSRAKKGKPPLASYYVLKLKPTTTKRDYEARNLWTNRVHLCRGHVREYTEERPLFGKYAGRFWIPPHARGDKKQGVIHKDYQLETTETQQCQTIND